LNFSKTEKITLHKETSSNLTLKRVVADDDNDDATFSLAKVSSITPAKHNSKQNHINTKQLAKNTRYL
jgi:hypothetical protein